MLDGGRGSRRERGRRQPRLAGQRRDAPGEAELREMAAIGAEDGIEVSLFVGPREGFGIGAHARTADGAAHCGQARGLHGLRYAVEDIARAVECGIRRFLIPDIGLLALVTSMQRGSELPATASGRSR